LNGIPPSYQNTAIILENNCYTELVYGRINKKLGTKIAMSGCRKAENIPIEPGLISISGGYIGQKSLLI
jgi:hypothetical protein